MKKFKILLAVLAMCCFAFGFAGCAFKELSAKDIMLEKNPLTENVMTKLVDVGEEEFSERISDDIVILYSEKEAEADDYYWDEIEEKYVSSESSDWIDKYTIYNLAENKVVATYQQTITRKLSDDLKTYTVEDVYYYVESMYTVDFGVVSYEVVKYTDVYVAKEGDDVSYDEYEQRTICYEDGTTFFEGKQYIYDSDLADREDEFEIEDSFLRVGENYYYAKDGKFELGFTANSLNNKHTANYNFRFGDYLYGFDDHFFVYDMSLNRVYAELFPQDASPLSYAVLPEGNVLYQYKILESLDSEDYTYVSEEGRKYTIITKLYNAKKQKASEIDYDYYFTNSTTEGLQYPYWSPIKLSDYGFSNTYGEEKITTVVMMCPIVDKRLLDSSENLFYAVLDKKGNIEYKLGNEVEKQSGMINYSDGVYTVRNSLGDTFFVDKNGVAHEKLSIYSLVSGKFYKYSDGKGRTILLNAYSNEKYTLGTNEFIDNSLSTKDAVCIKDAVAKKVFYLCGDSLTKLDLGSTTNVQITGVGCGFGTITDNDGLKTYTLYNISGAKIGEFKDTEEEKLIVSVSQEYITVTSLKDGTTKTYMWTK